MLKQDLLVAVVSVSAIVYVILFDTPTGTLTSGPGSGPGALSPLMPSPVAMGGSSRSSESTTPEAGADTGGSGPIGEGISREPLLSIRPEGALTPQGRARLVAEARAWLDRPIPGEFPRLKDEFESISQLADSLALYRVGLDEKLSRAFTDKLGEIKRYYLLQRTTLLLGEIATNYSVPSPAERTRVAADLTRLRELAHDVDWVEQRYSFVYPQDRKDYLRQLIEVLEGMDRMSRS